MQRHQNDSRHPLTGVRVVNLWGVLLLCAASASAQVSGSGRVALDAGAGTVAFPDDGVVTEALVSTAVRYYVSPRWSIGGEYVFISGRHHTHQVGTGSVMFDLLAPRAGRPRRVTPFLVLGGGLYQTREQFFTSRYTSWEPALTGGGGVRVAAARAVSLGLDLRTGWEPHVRINGFVTVHLNR